MNHKHQERLLVERDGEELAVMNALNVTLAHQVRGGVPTHETFHEASSIEPLGGGSEPDYVTRWVADPLWHEHGIDLETSDHFDIEVIDIESDDVTVL
jgi:hypothetical protein